MGKEWYDGKEEEIKQNFRKMSPSQLSKHYNVLEKDIRRFVYKYNLKHQDIVYTLTDEEVIFMYNSLLNNEIKSFKNGFYHKQNKYYKIIVRYLFDVVLKYNRNDICNNININLFKKYKLSGLLARKKTHIVNILNEIYPTYDIKPWELKKSSVGNMWKNENVVKEALKWFKSKLVIDKNIKNIYEFKNFEFKALMTEYNLMGLFVQKYNNVDLFLEDLYNTKFDYNFYIENRYTFKINSDIDMKDLRYKDMVYIIQENYYNLDDIGRTLINEVIKFCEDNNKFPCCKDMSNKRGYISISQYEKYFKNGWTEIYNYIKPMLEIKPELYKCHKCGIEKSFNNKYFSKDVNSKFGLKKICKDCEFEYSYKLNLNKRAKKYNISKENIYNPIIWYETYIKYNLKQMPMFCYEEDNLINIIRYIALNKLSVKNEYDLVTKFNKPIFKKCRITNIVHKFNGKLNMFKKCFPEFEFNDTNNSKYMGDVIIEQIIENWIKNNKYTAEDMLKLSLKKEFSDELLSLSTHCFDSYTDTLLWYFNKNSIKHPVFNRNIKTYDFAFVTKKYWDLKANRINRVRDYCETECEISILKIINDTRKLKRWIYKYFKSENVSKLFTYSNYNSSLYATLVETYPQIKENNILFEWEWHQCSKNDKEFLIKALREFILYRLNNVIIDIKEDVPIYINRMCMLQLEPKLHKQIDKNRFKNYYEWCCLAFPEYAKYWSLKDFEECIAFDDTKCDSKQELMVYEFLKRDMNIKYLKNIGKNRTGKYIFEVNDISKYKKLCPDFIIEYDNNRNKLNKPIIIEYYGMYEENNKNERFIIYKKKTNYKNKFYKSLKSIDFIALYPDDIKNNYNGIKEKIKLYLNKIY